MLFSVIVPVYKTEKYLRRCVQSVLSQTFEDFELILVDDGSPDSGGDICDRFALEDSRVKVVHKDNGGLSSARNAGLDIALGEYVLFLDSDDFWRDDNALEIISNVISADPSDILIFEYQKVTESALDAELAKLSNFCNQDVSWERKSIIELVSAGHYRSSSCDKAVRRSLITMHRIRFREGVTSEDIEWSAYLAVFAHTFLYMDYSFYCYVQREGSISYTMNPVKLQYLHSNIQECILIGNSISDTVKKDAFFNYIAYQYFTLLANIARLKSKDMKKAVKEADGEKYLLDFDRHRRVRIVRIFSKLFGIHGAVYIMKWIFRFRSTVNC